MNLNVDNTEFSLKISDVCRNVGIARVIIFVNDLGTVCNYGYSFSHDCI